METFYDIISGEVLTLVDFYATWCGPCKAMHPILEQVKEKLGDQIRIIKIDVDKHRELSLKYEIQAVPTFILFRKGETLHRFSGGMPRVDLIHLLELYLQPK